MQSARASHGHGFILAVLSFAAISSCAAPELGDQADDDLALTAQPADAGAGDARPPSRHSLAVTRLMNTAGTNYCRLIGIGGCASLVESRRGPHGEYRPYSYDLEATYELFSPVIVRDELEADPRFGPDEERRALAAFKRWEVVQPRSRYVVSTEFALLTPLVVEDDSVVLSVGKVVELTGGALVFSRRVVWLDSADREVASVPARALRVWPDRRILLDEGPSADYIGDVDAPTGFPDSHLGMYRDGAPVPVQIAKGYGHVMPSYVWPAGPTGGYATVSTSTIGGTPVIDVAYSRIDDTPEPVRGCGELVRLHARRDDLAAPVIADSAEGRALLRYVNTVESEEYGYMSGVITAWAGYRNGPDQRPFTRDDNLFDSIDELIALGANPRTEANKLYDHDYLVNPCASAADEARALAIYRTWRRNQRSAYPRTSFQFLGPVLVAPDKVALAIKSGLRQPTEQVHRYFVLWLDDSARVLRRIDSTVAHHAAPGGGVLLGYGADWLEGYNTPSRPTRLSLSRLDAAGSTRSTQPGVTEDEIWPLRDSGRMLVISRPTCCVHHPEEGEPRAVDVMTMEAVDRPWGIPPEPSLDGW